MTIPGPPPELEWTTFLLVGMNFPRSDEDKMMLLSGGWGQFKKDMAGLPDLISKTVADMKLVGRGPGIDAAIDFLSQISGAADELFPDLDDAVDDFSGNAALFGMQVQYSKMIIIAMSAQLLYLFIEFLKWLIITGGAVAPAFPIVVKTFQELAEHVLNNLLLKAMITAGTMAAIDLAIQAIQHWALKTRPAIDHYAGRGLVRKVDALGAVPQVTARLRQAADPAPVDA